MNYFKSIFVLSILTILLGTFSANAQNKLILRKTGFSAEVKKAAVNHLKAGFEKHASNHKATPKFSPNEIKGFNIGMPPTKNIIIIIFVTDQVIRKADRLSTDALKISAELGAGLKARGIAPEKSMAFQVNTKTLKVEKFSGVPGTGKQ